MPSATDCRGVRFLPTGRICTSPLRLVTVEPHKSDRCYAGLVLARPPDAIPFVAPSPRVSPVAASTRVMKEHSANPRDTPAPVSEIYLPPSAPDLLESMRVIGYFFRGVMKRSVS